MSSPYNRPLPRTALTVFSQTVIESAQHRCVTTSAQGTLWSGIIPAFAFRPDSRLR